MSAFSPSLEPDFLLFFRRAYGVLLLATLIHTLPSMRRFFLTERWKGYAQSLPETNCIQNPFVMPVAMLLWFSCAFLLIFASNGFWPSLINLLLCRYFFIELRWKGILRGMGAPGFVTHWLALAVFILEFFSHFAPGLQPLALWTLQIDFAGIMICSGVYKFLAGYRHNEGMEYGMANPQWGYHWKFFSKWPPSSLFFKFLDQSAWSMQTLGGILMLIPQTRLFGSLIIAGSFVFIATQIRLGFLCEMVILGCFLYFPSAVPWNFPSGWQGLAAAIFLIYISLLPFIYAGLFYNFVSQKSMPERLQKFLDRYANFFGIILWRVFTAEIINFFIYVYREKPDGSRSLVSKYCWKNLRFGHVGECITLTSLFTSLKYYPSQPQIFRDRLMCYAQTIPCDLGESVIFEYVRILKKTEKFEFLPTREFKIDPAVKSFEEKILAEETSTRPLYARIHESLKPGTYAPPKTVS